MPLFLTRKLEAKASKKFEEEISNFAMKQISERIQKARNDIVIRMRTLVEDAIKNSIVFKGLAGYFPGESTAGYDLQAEFGLNSESANTALNRMLEILMDTVNENSVRIETSSDYRIPAKIVLDGVLDPETYEPELTSGSEFSYNSEPSKEPIQWMEWLLNASSDIVEQILPNVANYAITYKVGGKATSLSRSGRAIMIKKPTIRKKRVGRGKVIVFGRRAVARISGKRKFGRLAFPYQFPKIALPQVKGSRNFIEDISLNPKFRKKITDEIEKAVLRVFERRQTLPSRLTGKE